MPPDQILVEIHKINKNYDFLRLIPDPLKSETTERIKKLVEAQVIGSELRAPVRDDISNSQYLPKHLFDEHRTERESAANLIGRVVKGYSARKGLEKKDTTTLAK